MANTPKPTPEAVIQQRIAEAAARALAEVEARRKQAEAAPALPPERGGRNGPEPTRFGDWEKKGIISDF
ncbi:hypothetical protein FHS83_001450 [Rhizomicrobium palustre]|uniref:DUF1674 domain-containing protein n=1 Tax=Rhizomicrobium palustre TaxID=189966 RepID=A0A846MYM2_9PROT|nr:DUF1674 domain-containing protein [Rhizomicrobium palustre]NIK88132.1 hypothetical protein [Rhizomicrobium palustre]